ncbi:LysR family transcriptional regulator [Collimonas silvisoli]|uniref:LysR family transcriptional regulator n=1 Tax=Collimonas silvisoli TaxID=2825884 RepID=UPI001B8DA957|nr:LysR family transcriptional regulator [Collimonas silvisoli]
MTTSYKKIDLITLRLFVTVCQEKNIARAAEREFIAHSAISRRISELEAIVGHPVIDRGSRGISITPAGRTVLKYAESVLSNLEEMEREIKLLSDGALGKVRLVGNLSSIVQFLPEDLAAFQRSFPQVDIDLEEKTSSLVMQSIRDRTADIGVCNALDSDSSLAVHPYRKDRLMLMVPKGHRLGEAGIVHLQDFLNESFVGLNDDSALALLLASQAQHAGNSLNIKMRVSSLDALCRMVHVGLGVAVVPQQIGEMYLNTLDICLIPIADTWATRQLVLVYNCDFPLTATAASLVSFLMNKR